MNSHIHACRHPLALALGAVVATLAAPALAQSPGSGPSFTLEEIVVTARKREENLSDIPFSIAVQTEEQLRRSGAADMESMSRNVAGLTVQNLGPGQSQVAIRGVSAGQLARDLPGVKEQVGVYLDESVISLSLYTPDLDFYDANRIEVLRGPQGTLFGAGSMSGTVRYITNQPSMEEFSGTLDASASMVEDGGEGGDLKGMVNIPMGERAALRLVGYSALLPGYIDAIRPVGGGGFTRDDDVNDGEKQGFRAALLLQPTEELSITPRFVYQNIEVDGMNRVDEFNIFANPYATSRQTPELDERSQYTQLTEKFEDEFKLADLTVEYDFGSMVLTSVTSYTERDIMMLRDATQLTGSITGQPGVFRPKGYGPRVYGIDAPLDDSTDVEMTTQELRLASSTDDPLQWVGGVFWTEVEREYSQILMVNGFEDRTGIPTTGSIEAPKDSLFYSRIPYELEQTAVFGELNYAINDQWSLTGGLRWFKFEEERTLIFDGLFAVPTNAPGDTDSDGYSPRVILRYDMTEAVQLNAQVSQGLRLGGINDPLNAPLCNATDLGNFGSFEGPFDDEELTNYELGAKMDMMGGRSTFNVAVFYSDIENLQATIDAGSCSSRLVVNVEEAHSQGIEAEWFVVPVEGLELALTGSWTDSQIDSDVTTADGLTILSGLEDGADLPTVPEFQMAASATYTWPLCCTNMEGFVNGTWQYVGERWTQFGDEFNSGTVTMIPLNSEPLSQATYSFDPELGSYDLLNLRAGVMTETWEAALFLNNALDETAELALDRERGFRARQGYLTNQPRTVGLSGRLLF